MRRRKWLRTAALLGAALLAAAGPFGGGEARAADGSVTIELHGNTELREGIPLSGMVFHLEQAAVQEADGSWQATGDFAGVDLELGDFSAAALEQCAEDLYTYGKAHGVTGQRLEADMDGRASWPSLEEGLYLLWPEGDYPYADEQESGVFRAAPFLLTVPMEINGQTIYDVRAAPKVEWIPDKAPEVTPPGDTESGEPAGPPEEGGLIDRVKTGDPAKMSWHLLWLLISVVVIADMAVQRRRERRL